MNGINILRANVVGTAIFSISAIVAAVVLTVLQRRKEWLLLLLFSPLVSRPFSGDIGLRCNEAVNKRYLLPNCIS